MNNRLNKRKIYAKIQSLVMPCTSFCRLRSHTPRPPHPLPNHRQAPPHLCRRHRRKTPKVVDEEEENVRPTQNHHLQERDHCGALFLASVSVDDAIPRARNNGVQLKRQKQKLFENKRIETAVAQRGGDVPGGCAAKPL